MSEDKKPFTVSDRRHFTSEGEVRKSDAEDGASGAPASAPEERASPAKAEAAPAAPSPPAEAAGAGRRPEASAAAAGAPEAEAAGAEPGEEPGGRFPSDFLGLLISLGAQASMMLMGGPEGEPPDLDSAHALIELLGDLKQKTEGRRTPQEDQLLEGLLYELRMAYVQATRAGGR